MKRTPELNYFLLFGFPVFYGSLGLIGGFIFPHWLNPSSNIAPVVGLFVTGPIGFVYGTLLFVLSVKILRIRENIFGIGVVSLFIIVALTFYLSLPDKSFNKTNISGEIVECIQIDKLVDNQIEWWKQQETKRNEKWNLSVWEPQIREMVSNDRGSILKLKITKKIDEYILERPWKTDTIQFVIDSTSSMTLYSKCGNCIELTKAKLINREIEHSSFSGNPPVSISSFYKVNTLK